MAASISERLIEDLKLAMKSGDNDRRDVVRLLRSAMKNRQIELRRELDDVDEIEVVQAQIKQRRDSIEAYDNAGRDDLAGKERTELEILQGYLPAELQPLDEAELVRIVASKTEEMGLSSPADMRVLMPALIAETGGRADNRVLSQLATAELRKRAQAAGA